MFISLMSILAIWLWKHVNESKLVLFSAPKACKSRDELLE